MKNFFSKMLVGATLLSLPVLASAQIITTSPVVLQRSSTGIVITYHADQGNKGLANLSASEAVYAHVGYLLPGAADSDWKGAPTWGTNTDKYKMTYVSPNTYTLDMGTINSYFGITDATQVARLAFVFRNSTGSKEGKTAEGGDIFVTVYPDGEMSVELSSSLSSEAITSNSPVTFTLNCSQSATLEMFVGNTKFASGTGTTLTGTYSFTAPGDYVVTGRATTSSGAISETTLQLVRINGTSPQKNYPGGVPKMGAITNSDGSVTFCIAAPKKSSAFIVGSWCDYALLSTNEMYYQDYNGFRYFWITLPGLANGANQIYYYLIDGQVKVGDPYANLILDPYNDKWISESVFPNLPPYPEKVGTVPLAVYNSKMNDYNWQVKDFKGVAQNQLVVYELLFRDFTGTEGAANGNGTVASAMTKLQYLRDLGVNAIELLPIMEFNGNLSWGYNTNFYFAPDKAYGTPNDYRRFIDECHKLGMAVILDIVFNQSDGLHPWYQMYPIAQNPFYNGSAPHAYSVLNDWNQDNALVQQQFQDALKYWLTEYNVDGFRFDLVKGLGSNASYNATYNPSTNTFSGVTDAKTNNYNASRVARMKELHNAMRTVNPNAYFINENLAGAQEENEMATDGEINWANINDASCQFAMGYESGSNLQRFYAPLDSRTWGSTVSYAESHDEERMAYKISQWGVAGVKGNTEVACRRLGSVAAQMLMTPGAHMIWQFQEFGADQTTKNSDGGNNTDNKKVIWSYLNEPNHAGLMQSYKELCWLRQNNPELFAQGSCSNSDIMLSGWNGGRTIKLKAGAKELYLVVNPTLNTLNISVPFANSNTSTAYELKSCSYNITPSLSGNYVVLPAGGYAVYGTPSVMAIDNISVDKEAPSFVVWASSGTIHVEGEYSVVKVFSLSGGEIGRTDSLAPGVYIVVVDGQSQKIAVN